MAVDAVYISRLFFSCMSNLYSGRLYRTSFQRQMTMLSLTFTHNTVSGVLQHKTKGSKGKLGHVFRVPTCHLDMYSSAVLAECEDVQIA